MDSPQPPNGYTSVINDDVTVDNGHASNAFSINMSPIDSKHSWLAMDQRLVEYAHSANISPSISHYFSPSSNDSFVINMSPRGSSGKGGRRKHRAVAQGESSPRGRHSSNYSKTKARQSFVDKAKSSSRRRSSKGKKEIGNPPAHARKGELPFSSQERSPDYEKKCYANVKPKKASSQPESCDMKLNPNVVVTMLSRKSLPKKGFGRCALVGSGPDLTSKGHGREIDRHDTVIRPNRIPDKDQHLAKDVGKRTDVLFDNLVSDLNSNALLTHFLGSKAVSVCDLYTGLNCHFKFLVMESRSDSEQYTAIPQAAIPVAFQNCDVNLFQHSFIPSPHVPSAGFKAFLTFIALCDSLTLFGFSSSGGAIDGHIPSRTRHDFDFEHKLMGRISTGKLSMPSPRSQAEQQLIARIGCMAKKSLIKIIKD